MRTGHELILATKKYAIENPVLSWWHLLSTSVLFVAAVAGTLAPIPLAGKLACSVLTGLLMLRLFVIYHDQQHQAILTNSRLAEFIMKAFGILALSPSTIWRSSHNHHHNHNSKLRGSHIGSFPIMTKEKYLQVPKDIRWKYLFQRHPLTILFGYVFVFLLGMCLVPFINDPRRHLDSLAALLLHITIAVVLLHFFGLQTMLITQTLPHFITYAIGSYLFYAQHNFQGVQFRDNAGWTYETAALDSSSFLKTGPLMAWFSANIGYHHVHHLNAKIPFYRLPEVLREMPELQSVKTTSLNPVEIVRCLRLKVWDAEAQRMVGMREVRQAAAVRAAA